MKLTKCCRLCFELANKKQKNIKINPSSWFWLKKFVMNIRVILLKEQNKPKRKVWIQLVSVRLCLQLLTSSDAIWITLSCDSWCVIFALGSPSNQYKNRPLNWWICEGLNSPQNNVHMFSNKFKSKIKVKSFFN